MRVLVKDFEMTTDDYSWYSDILDQMSISRIYLDMVINVAISEGLIRQGSNKELYLKDDGKKYAMIHNLASV